MLITTKKDFFLLKQICEYNILNVDQLALINNSGRRIIQKKIAKFSKHYLVNLKQRYSSENHGRPENIISISEKGVKLLQNENLIDSKIPVERFITDKIYNIEHELLINWFRILLKKIESKCSNIKTEFISSTTPFIPLNKNGQPLITENLSLENSSVTLIPDGVFYIKSEKQNKSLLFFLEVDMGTESLQNQGFKSNSIATKIQNYQAHFQSKKYLRYQKKWNTIFNGFRLLILTNTTKRKVSISNFINSDSSNDFVWVADQYEMFEKGLGGRIWSRGGKLSIPQESILGPTINFEERIIQPK
ncbi:MAG: replication-relaxation family protein [Ignavibacteriae bacterium]|nr:replication-relaxation family protein [Ignavibacteriota bacterium]